MLSIALHAAQSMLSILLSIAAPWRVTASFKATDEDLLYLRGTWIMTGSRNADGTARRGEILRSIDLLLRYLAKDPEVPARSGEVTRRGSRRRSRSCRARQAPRG
jgi:hypothetical protein